MTDVVGNPEEERRAEFYHEPWSQEAVSRYFYCKVRRKCNLACLWHACWFIGHGQSESSCQLIDNVWICRIVQTSNFYSFRSNSADRNWNSLWACVTHKHYSQRPIGIMNPKPVDFSVLLSSLLHMDLLIDWIRMCHHQHQSNTSFSVTPENPANVGVSNHSRPQRAQGFYSP